MIYLSDDYLTKYCDTLSYIIGRSINDGYSFSSIEKEIADSKMIKEFERSNITTIAFSSVEKLYSDIFPDSVNTGFKLNVYDVYGWVGLSYIHLFIEMQITFETLFIVLPIKEMINLYPLYHEMSFSQLLNHAKELIPYSYLDNIMKKQELSTNELSQKTGIPFSTINQLRYGKRDIGKLESNKLLTLSKFLNVRPESLLNSIQLDLYN